MDTLQLKRLISVRRPYYTPEEGEPLYEMDTRRVYIGDGIQAGGYPVNSITFAEIEDVPITISGSFFKRNSNNTAYEWGHAASQFTDLVDVPSIYPSSDNYVNVVIDRHSVENDLTNAAIKLEIPNSLGPSVVADFNKGLVSRVGSSFITSDGASLNPLLWYVSDPPTGSNATLVYNNKLMFRFINGVSDSQAVRSTYHVVGDFDVQVDWTQSTNASPNRLFVGLSIVDDTGKAVDVRRHNYGEGAYQWVSYTEAGYFDYDDCNFSSGTFRIKRTGNSFSCYIKDSNSSTWVAAGTKVHTTIGTAVRVGVFTVVESTFPSIDVSFDNIVISSGNPAWSELHPYRKKLHVTTSVGEECNVGIEKFDTINNAIILHAVVPEVSSDRGAKLKLFYSLDMEDNPHISDTVTVSGINDLAIYYMSSIIEDAYIGINESKNGLCLKLLDEPPNKFTDLYDVPLSYDEGKYLVSTASGIVFSGYAPDHSIAFTDLVDTPKSYTNGNYLRTTTSGIQSIDGIILTADDYSEWRIKVTTSGVLYTEAV